MDEDFQRLLDARRAADVVELFEGWRRSADVAAPEDGGEAGERRPARHELPVQPFSPTSRSYNLYLWAHSLTLPKHPKPWTTIGSDVQKVRSAATEMRERGLQPTAGTYAPILRTLAPRGKNLYAERVFAHAVEMGVEPTVSMLNSMVQVNVVSAHLRRALEHLRALREKAVDEPMQPRFRDAMYDQLINKLVRNDRLKDAAAVMRMAVEDGANVGPQALTWVASLAAERMDVGTMSEALAAMRAKRPPPKLDEGTLLMALNAAARMADVQLAEDIWGMVEDAMAPGRVPVAACFSALVHTRAAAGDVAGAFRALGELQAKRPEEQVQLNELQQLVVALSESPERMDAGWFALVEMQEQGVVPSAVMIDCVILACARAGDLERAFQTLAEMEPTFGIAPTAQSFSSVFEGCVAHGRAGAADTIMQELDTRGLELDAKMHSLLVQAAMAEHNPQLAIERLNAMADAGHTPPRLLLQAMSNTFKRANDSACEAALQEVMERTGHLVSTPRQRGQSASAAVATAADVDEGDDDAVDDDASETGDELEAPDDADAEAEESSSSSDSSDSDSDSDGEDTSDSDDDDDDAEGEEEEEEDGARGGEDPADRPSA